MHVRMYVGICCSVLLTAASLCIYTLDLFFFSVGLPVANAPDVLQPCGLLYYP